MLIKTLYSSKKIRTALNENSYIRKTNFICKKSKSPCAKTNKILEVKCSNCVQRSLKMTKVCNKLSFKEEIGFLFHLKTSHKSSKRWQQCLQKVIKNSKYTETHVKREFSRRNVVLRASGCHKLPAKQTNSRCNGCICCCLFKMHLNCNVLSVVLFGKWMMSMHFF